MPADFPKTRLRRLREQASLRDLVRETQLSLNDLILPLFIRYGKNERRAINSMPGLFQLSVDQLPAEIEECQNLGINKFIVFGIPEHKNEFGSDSYDEQGVIQQAIRCIKQCDSLLLVIADTCFCEYTEHGHCGVVSKNKTIDNDATLTLLGKQAVAQARAGADVVAPSGMMDGMVGAIRSSLDAESFYNVPILSYAIKYSSALYGPFREAAEGAPHFGDRSNYQMDPANTNEALREAALDLQEGADMLMVKPASFYSDVLYRVKQKYPEVPIGAYQVSGEFAMIKAASQKGWLDERKVALESLLTLKRAGASFIISYFTKDVARWLSLDVTA